MTTKEKKRPNISTVPQKGSARKLILFNDDMNTFDFVIDTLITVCGHGPLQAENCVLIAHFKGKCVIKTGTWEDLKPCYTTMIHKKLTVEIQ